MKEINVLEGKVVAKKGMKAAIVAARFNEIIVNKLLGGAVDGLVRHGVEEENITAAWVPGAFEIPLVAERLAKSGKYDAILSLYHDQGHIACKTLDFEKSVTLTFGLPFIRSSVDHGTAFDIAGKGIADEVSLIESTKVVAEYAAKQHESK